MSESKGTPGERRAQPRQDLEAPAILITASGALEATSLNISPNGALIQANGCIKVILRYRNADYRGTLVRMVPDRSTVATYAVHLDDPMPE